MQGLNNLPFITSKVTSVEHVFNSPNAHLSRLIKTGQEDQVKALLTYYVTDYAMFLNVGNNMSQEQVLSTVELIIEKYYLYKPEDFELFFKRAKMGAYGTSYNRVDGVVILEMLARYDEERAFDIAILNEKKTGEYKESNRDLLATIVDKAPTEMKSALEESLRKKMIKIASQPKKEISEEQKIVSEVMAEFDEMYKNQPSDKEKEKDGLFRMVEYQGRKMDIEKYVLARIEEIKNNLP